MSIEELNRILELHIFEPLQPSFKENVSFRNNKIIIDQLSIASYILSKTGEHFYMGFSNYETFMSLYDFKNVHILIKEDERFPIIINPSIGEHKIILESISTLDKK